MSLGISLRQLSKRFARGKDAVLAVDRVSLDVEAKEMVAFLGPSGSGKTTILRIIAGFERPTEGRVVIGGQDVTDLEANARGIGFIFQNYALFPHMTVFDNVAYGLRAKRVPVEEIPRKVVEVLEMVGLKGVEKRFPSQLSGGEQQRVALARVFVLNPRVLLMDEPLANLDASLRTRMLAEIRRLQRQLGTTCVYVTHDQKEALTLADRVAVLNRGRLEQVGTPLELYEAPENLFVADFIGQANLPRGVTETVYADSADVFLFGRTFRVRHGKVKTLKSGEPVGLAVRPSAVNLERPGGAILAGRVESRIFAGDRMEYEIELEEGVLLRAYGALPGRGVVFSEGEAVGIRFDSDDVMAFPS
jgi:iron(III) transport system ATP-binding protein